MGGGSWRGDEESALSEAFDRPVFVTHYPSDIKAFYMKRDSSDSRLALAVDLLAPEGYGEIIGGGQREDSLEALEQRIEKHGLPKEPLEWYLDLRRYGSVPHAGFGMGIRTCSRMDSGHSSCKRDYSLSETARQAISLDYTL